MSSLEASGSHPASVNTRGAMGFYIRKSVSVGPLRFNISKSGVGVSAGMRGLRFGIGPRGNYVHMGRHGLYYRQYFPSSAGQSHSGQANGRSQNTPTPQNTHDELVEIESSDVSQMSDSSSVELLQELNEKQKKTRLWPIVAAVSAIVILIGISSSWPNWLNASILCVAGALTFLASKRDTFVKTVVLFYGFDEEMEKAYEELHNHALSLASCSKVWHIEASGRVKDRKYHAGASELVRRKPTFIKRAEPPYVKTNISTIAIGVGRQTLHFFPDRLLVYDIGGVGAVAYKDLELEAISRRFIESESVPSDAQIVDYTWQYVNKGGGPDKRFKNNRKLPVCLYEELTFRSSTGINEMLQLSRSNIANNFIQAIHSLASHLQQMKQENI